MKQLTQPPDIHQFVGILLTVFGIVLGLATYLVGVHVLDSYGGGILLAERRLLGMISGGIALAILAIAYSFAKD